MTTAEAWSIIGNQDRTSIRNMVVALQLLPRLNTPADNERLEAARICLKTKNPRYE